MKLEIGRGPWLDSIIYGIFTPIVLVIAIPIVVVIMAVLVIVLPFLGVFGLIRKID